MKPKSKSLRSPPVVLVFGGHDPSSGAGVSADAATLLALGCHPVVVVTGITVQNTKTVKRYHLLEPELVAEQTAALMEDTHFAACKIGMLGSAEIVTAVKEKISALRDLPVVLDPVLRADRGGLLSEADLIGALRATLLPRATVLTPNTRECLEIGGACDTDAAARSLLEGGCENVLVTGTHAPTEKVIHRLYQASTNQVTTSEWPRLHGVFHGSGCTLAAAVSGYLAQGMAARDAVRGALEYTWQTLQGAYQPGCGQFIPDRLYPLR